MNLLHSLYSTMISAWDRRHQLLLLCRSDQRKELMFLIPLSWLIVKSSFHNYESNRMKWIFIYINTEFLYLLSSYSQQVEAFLIVILVGALLNWNKIHTFSNKGALLCKHFFTGIHKLRFERLSQTISKFSQTLVNLDEFPKYNPR